tara:strand:+ start:76 stop:318 length:243 start_codon:yes stop_codon:yes gene_type:complete
MVSERRYGRKRSEKDRRRGTGKRGGEEKGRVEERRERCKWRGMGMVPANSPPSGAQYTDRSSTLAKLACTITISLERECN